MRFRVNEIVYVRCRVMGDQKSYALRTGEQEMVDVWFTHPVTKAGQDPEWAVPAMTPGCAILSKDDLVKAIMGHQ